MAEPDTTRGDSITRRTLLVASGGLGTAALAGCTASSQPEGTDTTSRAEQTGTATDAPGSELPTTSPPEVVRVDERVGRSRSGPSRRATPSTRSTRWAGRSNSPRSGRSRPTTAH